MRELTQQPTANSQQPKVPAPHQNCRHWVKTDGADPGVRIRVGLVLGLILLIYGGLSMRLVQIQVTQGQSWKDKAGKQEVVNERTPAERGPIIDRSGLPLAFNLPGDTVIADLKLIQDRSATARALAPLLNMTAGSICAKISRNDRRVVYLAHNVEPETAEKIRALKILGVGFHEEFRRTYPQGKQLCHVLGWAGMDGGMEGIERELDSLLSGTPGYLRYYRDAAHRLIALNDGAVGPADNQPPRDGLAITLTVDARLQETAEEQIALINEQFDPKSTTCVVMDVSTGAILAMACTPEFDPNAPNKCGPESRRNRILTDGYEPGSTFKTFDAAMALERKLWRRHEMIDCENGAWRIGGYRTLHDAHAYGLLSFDDVIAKSSNIGAAKIAWRLGLDGLYETVNTFGFGHLTGINLPGEVKGLVRPRKLWTADSVYSVAMGHEIRVTPIQLVCAYAAVVNGGVLYRPKIVQRIVNEQGEELYTLHAQPTRRVISEQTSQQMREVLTRVVAPGGTGAKAFCAEYAIGGKTGTTVKIDPITHTYSSTRYIGSFCGFAPAENPRLVCLVTVDEPRKGSGYYGGTVAAPAVREVLVKGLTLLNVPPRSADEQKRAIADSKCVAAH